MAGRGCQALATAPSLAARSDRVMAACAPLQKPSKQLAARASVSNVMEQIISSALLATAMPVAPTWTDLALRLACTLIAGSIIGYNRGERGKIAGLRTTLLVCMAASVAMLQMNYLLTLSGRAGDSFA